MPRRDNQHAAIFKGALTGGILAILCNLAIYFGGSTMGAEYLIIHPDSADPQPIPILIPMCVTLFLAMSAAFTATTFLAYSPKHYWRMFLGTTFLSCSLLSWFAVDVMVSTDFWSVASIVAMFFSGSTVTLIAIFHAHQN